MKKSLRSTLNVAASSQLLTADRICPAKSEGSLPCSPKVLAVAGLPSSSRMSGLNSSSNGSDVLSAMFLIFWCQDPSFSVHTAHCASKFTTCARAKEMSLCDLRAGSDTCSSQSFLWNLKYDVPASCVASWSRDPYKGPEGICRGYLGAT